ncbi:MAG: hypothetical protein NXI22_02345 [bacterium]|nr:hypothetical protein [bacterium]
MNIVRINEVNESEEYAHSANAIRDFLYMYFEIASDCRPFGDFDRAELGSVDPFKYLDIDYECHYQFRSSSEVTFLHKAAAVNLLCQIAQCYDTDECSGSTIVADFNDVDVRTSKEQSLKDVAPELFAIFEAFCDGRVVNNPNIHAAFHAAFNDSEAFHQSLKSVLTEVVLTTFNSPNT